MDSSLCLALTTIKTLVSYQVAGKQDVATLKNRHDARRGDLEEHQ